MSFMLENYVYQIWDQAAGAVRRLSNINSIPRQEVEKEQLNKLKAKAVKDIEIISFLVYDVE